MERGLILLLAAVTVYVAPSVYGTFHLSFSPELPVNISRDGCGKMKLCISTPKDCDPSKSSSCLFGSFNTTKLMTTSGNGTAGGTNGTGNGTNGNGTTPVIRHVNVELSGESEGYVAVGKTINLATGTSMVFICGRNSSNNDSFFFRTMQRNNSNNMLMPTERLVSKIRAKLNGSLIQCEFTVLNVDVSNPYVLFLATGTVNGSMLGPLNISLVTSPLDLNNPASNVPSTSSGAAVTPAHVLLLLMNMVTLLAMLNV